MKMSLERSRTSSPSQIWLLRIIVIVWYILVSYFVQKLY